MYSVKFNGIKGQPPLSAGGVSKVLFLNRLQLIENAVSGGN